MNPIFRKTNKNIFSFQVKEKYWLLLLFTFFIVISFATRSTYDEGDSVNHYLFAHFAFKHPELFFDLWAKPLFTILSAPFAWFGFGGMKIFNVIVSSLAGFFVYHSCKKLQIKNSLWAVFFLFLMPQYFLSMYSGLTEPLFSLILIASFYFILSDKKITSLSILSFLPFVRSEGNIILIVYLIYLLYKKEFRYIPFLAIGTFIFCLIGKIYFGDFLWIYHQNPYTQGTDNYGHGGFLHYFKQMGFIMGFPLYILLLLGFILMGYRLFFKKENDETLFMKEFFLLYGVFFAYFISHVLFWWQGWFHSIGMSRVMIAILPLGSIICLRSYNTLFNENTGYSSLKKYLGILFFLLIVIFPFIGNRGSLHFKKDFQLTPVQNTIQEISDWYKKSPYYGNKVYYSAVYFSVALDADPYDKSKNDFIRYVKDSSAPSGSIIFWDSWYSVIEDGVPLDFFLKNEEYEVLKKEIIPESGWGFYVIRKK